MPMLADKRQSFNLLNQYDAMINSLLVSGNADEYIKAQKEKTFVSFYGAESAANVAYGKFARDFDKLQKGSIAVVPVMGAMMRDSYCTLSDGWISGTRDLEATVKALDENENVDSVIFYLNSPGGQADGNESLSRAIQAMKTPSIVYFEGMASAAVYAFEGAKEIYAAESGSYWGSIGTYITLADDTKFWEEMGVNFLEIYAPQSTEKNIEFREAYNGNEEPMKKMLFDMTEKFIKSVKKSRPNLQDDGHVFKGKLYSAQEAYKIGAIDGIKPFDFALERARILGKQNKKQNSSTTQNTETMSINNENENQEKETKVGNWFQRVFGSNATTESATESLKKAQDSILILESSLAEQAQKNAELENSIKELKETNAALEASKSQEGEKLAAIENSIKEYGFENLESLIEDHKTILAHNKELGAPKPAKTPIDNKETNAATPVNNANRTVQDVLNAANEKLEQAKIKK